MITENTPNLNEKVKYFLLDNANGQINYNLKAVTCEYLGRITNDVNKVVDLISHMLLYDPVKRISSHDALIYPVFS